MQSHEGHGFKTTTFSSPAWPHLEINVKVDAEAKKLPQIEIRKYKSLEPADWALVAAAVKAANEVLLPGEPKPPLAGFPSDLGPDTQACLKALTGPLPAAQASAHLQPSWPNKAAALISCSFRVPSLITKQTLEVVLSFAVCMSLTSNKCGLG